ncbi:MAG: MFS transporter, partial [Candidatus Bathyarchaeia archaeon]
MDKINTQIIILSLMSMFRRRFWGFKIPQLQFKTNGILILTNTSVTASAIFIPNLADELGASNVEIGLIGAAYGVAFFISSNFFGRMADIKERKLIMEAGLLISAIAFAIQALTLIHPLNTVFAVGVMRFLAGFSAGIFPPALIAYVYEAKLRLGKFTAWGSLGWAVGSLAAGYIGNYMGIFLLSSMLFLTAFIFSTRLPSVEGLNLNVPTFPMELIKKNLTIYLAYFLRHVGASAIWVVFPLYLVSLDANFFWIGILYAINNLTQFMVMLKIDRFRNFNLILAGLGFSLVTFTGYIQAVSFYQIIPFQITLGFGWSCLYVGSLKFLLERNDEKATVSGLLGSVISLSSVIGPIFGGFISNF